jgi:CRP-like cAMP-binding protein
MTDAELRDKLRPAPLFREFTDRDFEELFALLDPVKVPSGETVVKQDDEGDAMFIVVEGRCRVVHHKGGRDIELAMLKGGDFFGEIALVDCGPRSADVIATTDVALLKITQAVISALAGVYPSAAFKLLIAIGRIMVERLRQANQRYVDSLLFPLQGKD